MKKRLMSGLLVLVMLTGLLTGCGGGNKGNNGDKVTLTIGVPQRAHVSSYDENTFTKYIEESLNIDLEFVYFATSSADSLQQVTLMAASPKEEMPDVLWGFYGWGADAYKEFGQDGYFLDLTELLEEHGNYYWEKFNALEESEQKYIMDRGTDIVTGGLYAMPFYIEVEMCDLLENMMYINKDWLEAVGMEAPKTVEELEKVLMAFKTQDPNGNGEMDEIPMLGSTTSMYPVDNAIINAFIYLSNNFSYNVENGKIYTPYTTEEYRQALIYCNKLCSQGLLSDLSYTITSDSEIKALITPEDDIAKVGIWTGIPGGWTSATSNILDQYVALAPFADATGKGGYVSQIPCELYWANAITKDCDNPEAAIKLFDFFYNDETVIRMRRGEFGVDWEYGEGLNEYGGPCTVKILNPNAQFEGASTWGGNSSSILTADNYLTIADSDIKRQADLARLHGESYKVMKEGRHPDEVVDIASYTEEEKERRNELRGSYNDYIKEARSLFVTGNQNPNNDAQWQAYLDKLEELGHSEMVEIVQAAYDRQTKE